MNVKTILNIFFISILFLSLALPIYTYAMPTGDVNNISGGISVEVDPDQTVTSSRTEDTGVITNVFKNYKEFITFAGGLATITMVGIFIWSFIKLGGLGTEHWILKRSCMINMLWSGLAAVLLGSGTLMFAFFYNMFG